MRLCARSNAVLTGAASQVEQVLACDISEMAEDETILRGRARFKIVVRANAIDLDGVGPTTVENACPLEKFTERNRVGRAAYFFPSVGLADVLRSR